ncbi:hypothetical protein [Piscirickettsia salmonis]|uniref:hypothetical protein n=1 Tax=Piscirickettsia salmonis TaxID=1238 RepID=UPI001EE3F294|nr:hypothetical protein [Piscirickettsia salmonis]
MAIVLSRALCALVDRVALLAYWRDLENQRSVIFCRGVFKGVRIIPIDKLPADYEVIKTQVTLLGDAEAFILQHLADYSIIDAIRAGLGLKQNNSKGWQCAEFAAQILKRCGLRLPERENLTPIELITLIKQGA